MTVSTIDRCRPDSAPVFLNVRSQVVHPVRFAIVFWDGPGDTLYAFEDQEAFARQRATVELHLVHVHELSAAEAAAWMSTGGKAVLHEVSVSGAAAFGNLKLAPG